MIADKDARRQYALAAIKCIGSRKKFVKEIGVTTRNIVRWTQGTAYPNNVTIRCIELYLQLHPQNSNSSNTINS
jgi:hypothetical protein